MRKTGLTMAVIAVAAAVAGFFLRGIQLDTIFDPYTGLAERNAPISIALMVLTAVVALAILGLAIALPRRTAGGYARAFGGVRPMGILLAALGLAVTVLAVLEALSLYRADALGGRDIVWAAGAAVSGVCLAYSAVGGGGGGTAVTTSIPVLWLCAWLIFAYMDRAADPVLLDYIYSFFALAFLILGFYFVAGYAFEKEKTKKLGFCSTLSVFFTGITLADDYSAYQKGVYLCLALSLLVYHLLLMRALDRPQPDPVPVEEPDDREEPGPEPDLEL